MIDLLILAAAMAQPTEGATTGSLISGHETAAPVQSTGYANVRKEKGDDPALVALTSASSFADCVVKKRPGEARTTVLEFVFDVKKRFPKLLDPACLPDKRGFEFISLMRFPGDTLHQMLGNALVRAEFAASGPTDFSRVPQFTFKPPAPTPPEKLAMMSDKLRAVAAAQYTNGYTWFMLAEMGDCVARRAPDAVRYLALTAIGSAEERVATKRLEPDLAACVRSGTKIRMRVSDVRGPTVLTYYRFARYVFDDNASSAKAAQ